MLAAPAENMRILYDGLIYAEQRAGGVNRYFANIIRRLPPDFHPILTTHRNHEINYPAHPNLKIYRYNKFRPERVSFRLEKLYFRRAVAASRIDIAHPTYYWLLTRRELDEYRCPVVLTVHDMIHEVFSAELDPTGRHAEAKRKALRAAQAIICVSEHTKNDLLERYPLLEDKAVVIPQASELNESLSHGPESVPERPYYLYVGARLGYKNFDRLLAAFARVATARPELALCVVGPALSRVEETRIAELKLTGRIETYGHIGDRHLAKLYRRSVALAYPSLYEGFGIPPVEAMACGAAVIAARAASIPEVVGDAGLLFDPYSTDDLADALALLFDDASERERLVARGRVRAKLFSWDRTAARTVEVYRAVAGR